MSRPVFRELASMVQARLNCEAMRESNTLADGWYDRWSSRIEALMKTAPSGAGIDAGTSIDLGACTGEKLVFGCSFHHHTEQGYDGWTEHTITVTASLATPGFKLAISGRNRNEIKDYLHDVYADWLASD